MCDLPWSFFQGILQRWQVGLGFIRVEATPAIECLRLQQVAEEVHNGDLRSSVRVVSAEILSNNQRIVSTLVHEMLDLELEVEVEGVRLKIQNTLTYFDTYHMHEVIPIQPCP